MKRNSLTPRHDQLVIPPSLTGLAQRRRDDGSNNDVGWLLGKARLADSIQQFHHSESENCLVLQHSWTPPLDAFKKTSKISERGAKYIVTVGGTIKSFLPCTYCEYRYFHVAFVFLSSTLTREKTKIKNLMWLWLDLRILWIVQWIPVSESSWVQLFDYQDMIRLPSLHSSQVGQSALAGGTRRSPAW